MFCRIFRFDGTDFVPVTQQLSTRICTWNCTFISGFIRFSKKQWLFPHTALTDQTLNLFSVMKKLILLNIGKKVKYTPVQALKLCTGRTARRRSRCIALLFLDHGTRREWGVRVTPRPLFTPGKDPMPIVQEAGWTPWPVWTGAENLAPNGI